jgi:hypothetical protein
LTRFAILVKIALEITKIRGQAEDEQENIFITMNEALELCLSKARADIHNPNNDSLARVVEDAKLINWINDEAVEHCTPFQFNSHALVQRTRRARADLVEFHVNELRWDEINTLALHHLDLLHGRMVEVRQPSVPRHGSLGSLWVPQTPIRKLRRTNLSLLLRSRTRL